VSVENETAGTPQDPALAEELMRMAERDHAAAHAGAAYSPDVAVRLAWRRLTVEHGDRLDEIMDTYGWPTVSLVGTEAARRAFLIAQHADQQLHVQRRAVRLMEQAVADGEASAHDLALLRDRMLVNSGHEQIYGTQVAEVRDGVPVRWPCADADRVDQLRAEVGMEPFATHAARFAGAEYPAGPGRQPSPGTQAP
jgi:hypothetical protein